MERIKVHFSRIILTCAALLTLNAVLPERLYILPACCTAQGNSCCSKTEPNTNPLIHNRSCCEVEVIELRQALPDQVAAQRNCPEFFPIELYEIKHLEHLTGDVRSSININDHLFSLRSNEKYPEPRIQI